MADVDTDDNFDWGTWVPDLIKAIEDGQLDSHLKKIVRAAYTRRSDLEGKRFVVPEELLVPVSHTISDSSGPEWLSIDGYYPASGDQQRWTFKYGANYYWKQDFYGKLFAPDPTSMSSTRSRQWTGLVLKIVEIGPAYTWVQIVTYPQEPLPTKLANARDERYGYMNIQNGILHAFLRGGN